MRAAVMGGSGYIGGELVRLLLGHPEIELTQVTSATQAGKALHSAHPNLRGATSLRFVPHDDLEPTDVVFLALSHGRSMHLLPRIEGRASHVIDLSVDFRYGDAAQYLQQLGLGHACPEQLASFVPGLPELHRDRIRGASRVSVPGCMATAAILALHPLARSNALADGADVLIDALTGSSGAGRGPSPASHHAERSGVMRIYQPLTHRHRVEVDQACRVRSRMTATAVEAVRGVRVLVHVELREPLDDKDLWSLYRSAYGHEPFVRLVAQRRGLHRWPEPKILSGSNFCDIGFAGESRGSRVVVVAALDNLMKGGAGNAVQCLNVAAGWSERAGLGFLGLHPI